MSQSQPPLAMQSSKDIVLANPAPLGLFGFGMTTILLNFWNAGAYNLDTSVLAMGIFYGGIAQIIAGIMEFRKGNTFGTTAFLSYGLFWETLVALVILPHFTGVPGPTGTSLSVYLFFWGLFTLFMFVGTLRLTGALMSVFGTLFILFFLLAAGNYGSGNTTIIHIAGYEGILCGLTAFYTAVAQVLNEVYGRVVLPLRPVRPRM